MLLSARLRLSFMLLALSLVGCDHATKHWAETTLRAAPHIELVPHALDLAYARNPGMAFRLLRDLPQVLRTPLLITVGVVAVVLLVAWWSRQRGASRWRHAAFALLLGGAVGNLTDRIAHGYVVDFILLHHWPVFNVADVCIIAGAMLLALTARRAGHGGGPDGDQHRRRPRDSSRTASPRPSRVSGNIGNTAPSSLTVPYQ